MPPTFERPSPAEQTAPAACLPAPAAAGQGVGTSSGLELFHRDSRDLLVSAFLAPSCVFLGRYSGHRGSGLVVSSPSFAHRCVMADALFPAQAMRAFSWQDVNHCAPFAWLIAVSVSAPVNRFSVCGWPGANQQGKYRSPKHLRSPFLRNGEFRMGRKA